MITALDIEKVITDTASTTMRMRPMKGLLNTSLTGASDGHRQ